MRRLLVYLCLAAALGACSDEKQTDEAHQAPAQFDLAATPGNHGERLTRVLGCVSCHGEDLTGGAFIEDPKVAVLFASNLTRVVPRYTDEQLAHVIKRGVRPDGTALIGMPSHIFTQLSERDVKELITRLRTYQPVGSDHPRVKIGPVGEGLLKAGAVQWEDKAVQQKGDVMPPEVGLGHDKAGYIVRATCAECHGLDLKGGENPTDGPAPPDLAIVSAYSRDQFERLLRTGQAVGDRKLGLMSEVSKERFVHLTDAEVNAIYNYLSAHAKAVETLAK